MDELRLPGGKGEESKEEAPKEEAEDDGESQEERMKVLRRSPLGQIKWRRVVFDESHNGEHPPWPLLPPPPPPLPLTSPLPFTPSTSPPPSPSPAVKMPTTAQARACALLVADRRWCCSGTPVNTDIRDLIGQLAALQLDPLCNASAFEALVRGPFLSSSTSHTAMGREQQIIFETAGWRPSWCLRLLKQVTPSLVSCVLTLFHGRLSWCLRRLVRVHVGTRLCTALSIRLMVRYPSSPPSLLPWLLRVLSSVS